MPRHPQPPRRGSGPRAEPDGEPCTPAPGEACGGSAEARHTDGAVPSLQSVVAACARFRPRPGTAPFGGPSEASRRLAQAYGPQAAAPRRRWTRRGPRRGPRPCTSCVIKATHLPAVSAPHAAAPRPSSPVRGRPCGARSMRGRPCGARARACRGPAETLPAGKEAAAQAALHERRGPEARPGRRRGAATRGGTATTGHGDSGPGLAPAGQGGEAGPDRRGISRASREHACGREAEPGHRSAWRRTGPRLPLHGTSPV